MAVMERYERLSVGTQLDIMRVLLAAKGRLGAMRLTRSGVVGLDFDCGTAGHVEFWDTRERKLWR